MDNLKKIVDEIDRMIDALRVPVTREEIADGWTEESKIAAKKLFENLKLGILNGESYPSLSVSRSLDMWGVSSGALMEAAARISNLVRDIANS